MDGRLICLALGALLGSLSTACLFSMGKKRKNKDLPSADTEGCSSTSAEKKGKNKDFPSADTEGCSSADAEGCSSTCAEQKGKNSDFPSADTEGCSSTCAEKKVKNKDFPSADAEGCSSTCAEQKGKISDFLSADTEGCSSTSAETFKHYEPSSIEHHKTYHVFLSFRGKYVRNTFVDRLCTALCTAGFHVFLDEERLGKGEKIDDDVVEAIGNSTVYIPIISDNYASSPWCLDHLSLFWTCKSTGTGSRIIPLFYNMIPSDVRYLDNVKSPYAKALQVHREKKRHSEQKMQAWKEALHQVSVLSGWSLEETAAGDEDKLLKKVVNDLQKVLPINDQHVAQHSVGLSDRVEEVTRLMGMNNQSRDVLFVGIWGMGGLGKTTLAKAVYNNIRRKFTASCFVPDVRASTKESVGGLLNLQKQILRRLANVHESTLDMLDSVSNAKIQLKSILTSIKALVVLDDVDDKVQLDALVGDASNGYWFREGSTIIITSRDRLVWKHLPVIPYDMRELNKNEGLKLFSWHAFMRTDPAEGYKDITKKIVDACQGLPLSLEVVGARLYSERSLAIWRAALTNLVAGNQEVYKALRISYDALNRQEKRIFLDIACFFLGPVFFPSTRYDKEFYVKLWQALNCKAPLICLTNVETKSLITINYSKDGFSIFWMHDHLRDLGRQIIEEDSLGNPPERSRFWCPKDLITAMNLGQQMPKVEGLVLDFFSSQAMEGLHQTYCSTYPWALMPNLKFMFIQHLWQERRAKLPPNLIFLGLRKCRFGVDESASETQPISFCLLKRLGKLRSLRFLDLSGCRELQKVSCMSHMKNLEVLDLSWCTSLAEFPLLDSMHSLRDLKLQNCESLQALPALPDSLSCLDLKRCRKLQKVPCMSHMKNLEVLDLSWCTSLAELPLLDSMHSLRDLKLCNCESLQALPALPDSLSCLDLSGCAKLQKVSGMSHMKNLEVLDLSWCTSLAELPLLTCIIGLHTFFKRPQTTELQVASGTASPSGFSQLS